MLLDWFFIAKIGLVSSGLLLRCSLMRCGSTVIYLPFMNFKSIINQVSHSCVWYFSIVFLAAHTCIKVLNIWIYGYFHCLTVCFIWSSVFGQFFVKLMFFYCLSCFALVPWSSKSSEVKLFSLFVAKKTVFESIRCLLKLVQLSVSLAPRACIEVPNNLN